MNDLTPKPPLSPEGHARRAAILAHAQRHLRARRRRRLATLAALALAPAITLALFLSTRPLPSPPPEPSLAATPTPPSQPRPITTPPTLTHVTFDIVRTDEDLPVPRVSDEQLIELLHHAGLTDAGLARLPGRVILTGSTLGPSQPRTRPRETPAPGGGA